MPLFGLNHGDVKKSTIRSVSRGEQPFCRLDGGGNKRVLPFRETWFRVQGEGFKRQRATVYEFTVHGHDENEKSHIVWKRENRNKHNYFE